MRSSPANQSARGRRWFAPVLILLASCGPSTSEPTAPTDSGTTDSANPTTAPGSVTGQEGDLVVIQRGRSATTKEKFAAFATFADELQGLRTPAWCLAGGPCLAELPAAGQFADTQPELFDPSRSTWAWNGHHLEVGGARIPLRYNPDEAAAWYQGVRNGSLGKPVEFGFDGEWGRYEGKVRQPDALMVHSPDPLKALPLVGTLQFRWTPTGGDEVYLRVSDGTFDRLWHLEDDGEFNLDIDALGLSGSQVSIGLQRWAQKSVDVHGNSLQITSIWEQAFEPLACDTSDYPVGNLAYGPYPAAPYMSPAEVAVSFQAVIDDHLVRDFWLDADGNGIDDLYTSAILFEFFDELGQHLCTVAYDASPSRAAASPVPQGGGTIFEGWTVDLLMGQSDCNQINPAVWGTTDVRDVLEGLEWGFGIGTVHETQPALQQVYDWNVWGPLLGGAYILLEGTWYEVGGVSSVGMESCGVVDSTLAAQPKPTGSPLPIRLYLGNPVVRFSLGG